MEPKKKRRGGARLANTDHVDQAAVSAPSFRAEKRQKPQRTRRQKILFGLYIALTVIAVLIVAAFIFWNVFSTPPSPDDLSTRTPQTTTIIDENGEEVEIEIPGLSGDRKEDFYTFLVVGRDTGGGGNTDTILLAAYDIPNQQLNVMSIPRDTMVNIPYDIKRINSVYNCAGGGDDGIQALYAEIRQLVGFVPDFSVAIEWEAIGQMVNAIGGVWFEVPWDMNYDDPTQDLHIHVSKGYKCLNGNDAMGVVRWRQNNDGSHSLGDIGRIEIQQAFLKAVISQCLQLKNVTKISQFAQIFTENVQTDLTLGNLAWFAEQAIFGGLTMDNINFMTMPGNYNASAWSRTYQNYQSYVIPYGDELLEMVNEYFNPFLEDRTADLQDIMSINSDGSLSSSTGVVEDSAAAKPPTVSKPTTTPTPTPTPTETNDPGGTDDPEPPAEPTPSDDPGATPDPEETGPTDEPGEGGELPPIEDPGPEDSGNGREAEEFFITTPTL